jgi:hypothetical protein
MATARRNTVINMIMDYSAFCFGYGPFNGVKLRREVKTRPAFLDHRDDAAQMPLGAFQPGSNCRVACMDMGF